MNQEDFREGAELRSRIEFGLDVEQFMGTPIGKYMQRRANQDIESALESLKTVDPEDPKAIRTLQNAVAVASNVLEWLGQAVTEGEQAERQFHEMG